MVHVFIVNERTFKYHLEYMFAGTGAGDKDAPFLIDPICNFNGNTERNLVGLIADISRVNIGDKIIFYLEKEARFFGVFEAASKAFFSPAKDNYLSEKLGRTLTFRIRIKPNEVFENGITEYQYLDSQKGINKPSDMCWSLIYRKLKGGRGCTMITDREFLRLYKMLKASGSCLQGTNFTYDSSLKKIIASENIFEYNGPELSVAIKDRLLYRFERSKFEVHLQAHILQNLLEEVIKDVFFGLGDSATKWIGNEVGCGVGMQRIDLLTIQENEEEVGIKVIELKCGQMYKEIIEKQMPRYINWVNDYLVPTFEGKKITITPVVLTYETEETQGDKQVKTLDLYKNVKLEKAVTIFFSIYNNDLIFKVAD